MFNDIKIVFGKIRSRGFSGIVSYIKNKLFPIHWCDQSKYVDNIKRAFKVHFGYDLPVDNPKTFSEKIQWLRIYDNTEMKTLLVDKYLVREWVQEKIGEEYLIPLLGVYDCFDDIDFSKLPNKFVIKCNHGCGYNLIVTDKNKFILEIDKNKSTVDAWMEENYGYKYGEIQYSNVKPKIIIEEFIAYSGRLLDYRYYCFGGIPNYIHVDYQGHFYVGTEGLDINSFYDMNWHNQKFDYRGKLCYDDDALPPKNFEKMEELARILSVGIKFVRVDLYNVNGKIYFGEMTFTPCGGYVRFHPEKWDMVFGDLLNLA